MSADLVFLGGRVHTVDAADTVAQAVAVSGGRIAAVGADAEVRGLVGPKTRVVELAGRTLLPGFVVAHCHLVSLGMSRASIDCKAPGMQSIEALQKAVRERALTQPAGPWIRGRGYDQSRLVERRHPNRLDWDAVAPEHPVIFTRTCGHIASVNSGALALAGIDDRTPDPPGGRYDREGGRNLGVAYETAQTPLQVAALPSRAELETALLAADAAYLAAGCTSVPGPGRGRPPAPPHLRFRHREQPRASAARPARDRAAQRARRRAAAPRRLQGDDGRLEQRSHRGDTRAVRLRLPRLRHPLLDAGAA